MAQTAQMRVADAQSPATITMRHGTYLFPTAKHQQAYLRGLDPLKCAPREGGRTIEKSRVSRMPMVEVIRIEKELR